jgi:hypothetical protein
MKSLCQASFIALTTLSLFPSAEGSVFAISAGYGLASGSATSVSTTSAGTRTSSVSFPTMFNGAVELGSEGLRLVLDGYVSYSSALAGIDLALWSVGGRWYPLNTIEGKPGDAIVASASKSLFLPYVAGFGTISQYNSIVRNRDGLLTKVTASSLGGAGAIGVDIPLNMLISDKPTYDSSWGGVFYSELRFMAHQLPTTSPSLTTSLFSGLAGLRWRF